MYCTTKYNLQIMRCCLELFNQSLLAKILLFRDFIGVFKDGCFRDDGVGAFEVFFLWAVLGFVNIHEHNVVSKTIRCRMCEENKKQSAFVKCELFMFQTKSN